VKLEKGFSHWPNLAIGWHVGVDYETVDNLGSAQGVEYWGADTLG